MTRVALLIALSMSSTALAQEEGETSESDSTEESTPEPAAPTEPRGAKALTPVSLSQYLEALASERLVAAETGNETNLRKVVADAEELYFSDRFEEAAVKLYEVAESPRFADFEDLPEFSAAEFLLAGALSELGSFNTASRYLLKVIKRGPKDVDDEDDDPNVSRGLFGPAYRRYVDVTLRAGSLDERIADLKSAYEGELPQDAQSELQYLVARSLYDKKDFNKASDSFARITRRSRFFANAQYLRGVIAARKGDLKSAEDSFCRIAKTDDQSNYSFFVDQRYFDIKDLAWLGLGRVAHEGARSADAFYYYFQVPSDSERVAEAMFESAYAMYEGKDNDTAMDLLDQLAVRFPNSPFVHEASLLRGYIHLSRCEFEKANQLFIRYQKRFRPVVTEMDSIIDSQERQEGLYDELLALEAEKNVTDEDDKDEEVAPAVDTKELLMSLLQVHPQFYQLNADVRTLDAEIARSGLLARDILALSNQLKQEAPVAAEKLEAFETEATEIDYDLRTAREVIRGLLEQIDVLRDAGASNSTLSPLKRQVKRLSEKVAKIQDDFQDQREDEDEGLDAEASNFEDLLKIDARNARRLPARAAKVRRKLAKAANLAALTSLKQLREDLSTSLRRARIGRIDAVMGSKRRIEIQIESLAAGRFPAELQDPLQVQGLLREDEEYWPFEGEFWADEFKEGEPSLKDKD